MKFTILNKIPLKFILFSLSFEDCNFCQKRMGGILVFPFNFHFG